MLNSENIKNISELTTNDTNDYGSKAVKMGLLMRKGFFVPNGFCVSSGAFNRYFENMEGFRDTDSSFVVKKEDVKTFVANENLSPSLFSNIKDRTKYLCN